MGIDDFKFILEIYRRSILTLRRGFHLNLKFLNIILELLGSWIL